MLFMTTPEKLRERANAADVAGQNEMADALRAEADELESVTPGTGGEVP